MKKRISILLVLVMVLAMIPMSAFAAPADANRFASSYTVNKTTVTANGDDTAKVTVYVFNGQSQPEANVRVYLASDRVGADTITPTPASGLTGNDGKVEFEVKSSIAGTSKLGVAIGETPSGTYETAVQTKLVNYLQGSTTENANSVGLIGSTFNLVFTAAGANGMSFSPAPAPVMANGYTQMTVTARVYTSGNAPVAGQEVTFTSNKTGLSFDKQTYTTNVAGLVTAKITTTLAGTYEIRANSGALYTAPLPIVFTPHDVPYTIEIIGGNNATVARGYSSDWLTVAVRDINANKMGDVAHIHGITFPTKPDGSNISALSLQDNSGNVRFKVLPDKVGDYVIRVALDNGKSVSFNLTAKEMGTITGLKLAYNTPYIAHGASSDAPTVTYVDASGVERPATANTLTYSLSDSRFGTVNSSGVFTATSTDNKIVGVVTITAIDTIRNIVASYQMTVGSGPATIALSTDKAVTPIDQDAIVTLKLLNSDGDVVGFGESALTRTIDARVISKPAGSIVTPTTVGTVDANLERKGTNDIKVTSTHKGEVVLQVIVSDGASPAKLLTRSITLTFGEKEADKVTLGAKNVILTIGGLNAVVDSTVETLDVAPFVKEGRTFVPVRFIAEAFGAEVSFTTNAQGLTETVTLTRDDKVVMLTIGSSVITVVENGKTTVIAADVAPHVVSGRTVLPFRALAEAMGAEVSFGMKADNSGVAWVSFAQ